jgi:hypothetical protein
MFVQGDTPMIETLRQRHGLFAALRQRCPNPIEVTVIYKCSFNRLTTWTCQLRHYVESGIKFGLKYLRRHS